MTSSNWGLCLSQMGKRALEVTFPECDYRLEGKYAMSFCSSAADASHFRLTACFSPSSQYLLLELSNGIKKPQTNKQKIPTKHQKHSKKIPLEEAFHSCHHRISIFLKRSCEQKRKLKHCSTCYCCKNSSQICFDFESCNHLALTRHCIHYYINH